MRRVLLLSGGMDSMAILFKYGEDFFDNKVYIDYGQKFKQKEYDCCSKYITDFLKIDDMKKDSRGFFYGRNLRLFLAIREKFLGEDICVYFGNTVEDCFSDNTFEYLMRLENILNNSYPNTIRICTPFAQSSKKDIYKIMKGKEFYYCDEGGDIPCGKCHSCLAMKGIIEDVSRH